MKIRIWIGLILLLVINKSIAQISKAETDKIDLLIKQMTLEEKVGQMTQVTMAVFAENGWGNQNGKFDPE